MNNLSWSYPGEELIALRDAAVYYRAILSYFAPYLGKRVIELGAGIGTFSHLLLNCRHITNLTLLEPADNLFPLLKQEFAGDDRVTVVNGYLDDRVDSFSSDSVVLVNVLEHCEDDEAVLRTIYRILSPGGTILLFVPALPCLYGSLDKAFGHVRRYTKFALTLKLQKAGFQVIHLRYFNFLGVVSWFLTGKVLRTRSVRPVYVRMYDRLVMSWLARLEQKCEAPVGQSLLAIGKK